MTKANFHSDGRTPDWKDLLNKMDSGTDNWSENSLNIRGGQPSGPGDFSVFSLLNSSNTTEAVIVILSNFGTEASGSRAGNRLNFHL